jgi:hypothetical protein
VRARTNGEGNIIYNIKSKTSIVYFFEERPEDDAIELCARARDWLSEFTR